MNEMKIKFDLGIDDDETIKLRTDLVGTIMTQTMRMAARAIAMQGVSSVTTEAITDDRDAPPCRGKVCRCWHVGRTGWR